MPAGIRDYAYGISALHTRRTAYTVVPLSPGRTVQRTIRRNQGSSAERGFGGGPQSRDRRGTAGKHQRCGAEEWIECWQVIDGAPPAGLRGVNAAGRGPDFSNVIPGYGTRGGTSFAPRRWSTCSVPRKTCASVSRVLEGKKTTPDTVPPSPEIAMNLTADLGKAVGNRNPYDRESLGHGDGFRGAAPRTRLPFRYPICRPESGRELEPANGPNFACCLGFFRCADGETRRKPSGHFCVRGELNADHPQSAAILGDIRSGRKDYPVAAADYEEAVKREPKRIELWPAARRHNQQLRGRNNSRTSYWP